jgi:hypothetical protein
MKQCWCSGEGITPEQIECYLCGKWMTEGSEKIFEGIAFCHKCHKTIVTMAIKMADLLKEVSLSLTIEAKS